MKQLAVGINFTSLSFYSYTQHKVGINTTNRIDTQEVNGNINDAGNLNIMGRFKMGGLL